MFPLMFVAIAAGLGTAAAVAPTSLALAVVTAPFGGSIAALATALYLARRNDASGERLPADLGDRTDSMVMALRGLEAQGRAERNRSGRGQASGKAGPGRHVA